MVSDNQENGGQTLLDSPRLLVRYSAHISGATVKISACWVLFQVYN